MATACPRGKSCRRARRSGKRAPPSPCSKASSEGSGSFRCCQAHRQSPSPHHLQKHTRSQGPSLRRHYPASAVTMTLVRLPPWPPPRRDVEAATLRPRRVSPVTRITFPTCRAHYPGGSGGCACRLLPHLMRPSPNRRRVGIRICHFRGLLRLHSRYGPPDRSTAQGGLCHEAPTPPVTRPKPLVSYQTYRLLSGWILPPLVIRAFGAHRDARGPMIYDGSPAEDQL